MELLGKLRRRSRNPEADRPPTEITAEHVRWAYRLFLDREPARSDEVREILAASSSTADLRRAFLSSEEFRSCNPLDLAWTSESSVVIKEIAPGLRVYVDLADIAIGLNVARGRYENREVEFVQRNVRPGDRTLDIGANIGFFTIWMASLVGPLGHVFAYEPLEQNFRLLERSLRENGFGDRVTLRRDGVGAHSYEGGLVYLPLASGSQNSGGAYLADPNAVVPAGHRLVMTRIVPLDSDHLLRPIRFIKIDVEGAEPLVFRGARRILLDDRPIILSEINPRQLEKVSGCRVRDLIAEMKDLGYRCGLLENSHPGPPIDDVPDERIRTVVFRPFGDSST
jgi:FkbM family methyltransferase